MSGSSSTRSLTGTARTGRPDRPGHHHHRLAGRPRARPGRGLSRKMAARDRERAGQDRPARARQDPAVRQPGPGRAGDLGLPPDRLGHQRPDLRRRRRRLDRPRPGQLHQGRPHRPPGRRPGLSPLRRLRNSSPAPGPRSPGRRTSTPAAPAAPIPASSNAGGPAPTPSRHHATTAPATTGHPPSDSSTWQTRSSQNRPAQAKRHWGSSGAWRGSSMP